MIKFVIRLLSIPFFIILIIIGIIEILSIILTFSLAIYFYEWLFKIDYCDVYIGTEILWNKLKKLGNE